MGNILDHENHDWKIPCCLQVSSLQNHHLLTYILSSVIMSINLNIPMFLEAEIIFKNQTMNSNTTLEILDFSFTLLRLKSYFYYTHWTRLLCTGIIAFFYLLFTNVCIFTTNKRSSKEENLAEKGKFPRIPNFSNIDKEKYADAVEGKNSPCLVWSKCKAYNKLEQVLI